MLIEFGMKNYFCFEEGVTISFELDKNCPKTISHGKSFTTLLAVKGANGSGKTQILKGLSFLGWFCTSSFLYKPEEQMGILPFFDSKNPSYLYAKFIRGDVTYLYELTATMIEIHKEVIYRTKAKGRRTKIFERKKNEITHLIDEFSQLAKINLRGNASVISTAHQYAFKELDDIYNFFDTMISNVTFGGLSDAGVDINIVSSHMHSSKKILNFTKSFIHECDVGISDVQIHSRKNEDNKDEYYPVFIHENEGKKHSLTGQTESSGTKMLFKELFRYHVVLEGGGTLVLDEFDRHLHPHILPKLCKLFEDPDINKHNAQLLFSTHDGEILNYLGRYRTYLVNKEANASYAYRLDEIPGDILRNDRPILPSYNDGKIGGVPKL